MAETQGPAGADDPFASDLSFEERLRALDALGAGPGPVPTGAEQRLVDQSARLDALTAEVAALRERLRDQEKALVERIADVDDDRRLTSQQLQRGWQLQREELRARLRRQGRVTALAGGLVLAGLLAVVWYTYSCTGGAVPAAELVNLRQEVGRLAGLTERDAQINERLTALATKLGEFSARPVPGGAPAVAALAAELNALAEPLERLTAEQRGQRTELDSLAQTVRGLVAMPQARAGVEEAAGASESVPPQAAGREVAVPAPSTARDSPAASETGTTRAGDAAASAKVGDRPFAVQLLGSYDRETLVAALEHAGMPETVYLYEETRRGRSWFVLIHSLYGDSAEARAALGKLPPELRRPAPWVRELPRGTDLEVVKRGR
jgi:DamX protein